MLQAANGASVGIDYSREGRGGSDITVELLSLTTTGSSWGLWEIHRDISNGEHDRTRALNHILLVGNILHLLQIPINSMCQLWQP
ncbi:hypothetical protein Tco_0572653 [Tanacetum coccineum]